MTKSGITLTSSLEDYLEAIYNLKIMFPEVRMKDIADRVSVRMPAATKAIRTLTAKGLVLHDPSEKVDLTETGLVLAREITHRHQAIKSFLSKTLGLSEIDADEEACEMEHTFKPNTLKRAMAFVDFAVSRDPNIIADFAEKMKEDADEDALEKSVTTTQMNKLKPGQSGRIAFVSGEKAIRKRLLEMGLVPNTLFEVIRVAPLGDPFEIKVRGYFLSLRKEEAKSIEVEID